jgi:hypothetical protein
VFEIFRQYFILKQLLILNDKATAIVCPLNNVAVPPIIQYFIGLHDKVGYLLLAVDSFFALVERFSILLLGLLFLALVLFFEFDAVAGLIHV